MTSAVDVASEALVLIDVATTEWLRAKAAARSQDQHLQVEHAKQAQRLRLIVGAHERLAEVDAQLAIVEVTPELPAHGEILARLRQIRATLASSLRRDRQ